MGIPFARPGNAIDYAQTVIGIMVVSTQPSLALVARTLTILLHRTSTRRGRKSLSTEVGFCRWPSRSAIVSLRAVEVEAKCHGRLSRMQHRCFTLVTVGQ